MKFGQVVLEREGGNGSKFMCCLNKKNDNKKQKLKKNRRNFHQSTGHRMENDRRKGPASGLKRKPCR